MRIQLPAIKAIGATAAMLVLGAAGVVAYAEQREIDNDAVAVNQATVTLIHAVSVAERHLQGRASRAEFVRMPQGGAYEVEVVQGDKVFDVRVDAEKGTILSSALDEADTGTERERKD